MDFASAAALMSARGFRYAVHQAPFPPETVRAWFRFASTLSSEREEAFFQHVGTVCQTHTLSLGDSDVLVGFQMLSEPRDIDPRDPCKGMYIRGGKVRIARQARAVGFPHLCAMVNLHQSQRPRVPLYRLSIASVFGFNSLHSVATDAFLCRSDDKVGQTLLGAVQGFCDDNGFDFDRGTGIVDVHFRLQDDLIASAQNSAFQMRPSVALYQSLCPDWRRGRYLAWGWCLSNDANRESFLQYVRNKSEIC